MPHDEAKKVEKKVAVLPVGQHGGLICADANAEASIRGGARAGASLALFDSSNHHKASDTSSRYAVGSLGASGDVSASGLDVGIDADVLRASYETEHHKIGGGLSLDTGLKLHADGARAHVLGFGFHGNGNGVGVKTPFFDYSYKF
ncbi:unnamed protein product [Caenorhabditis sp. 36 PRJEB53466]|nr:unnamed protein product [Caenorhabditis sp. 36 PRJEB53466]